MNASKPWRYKLVETPVSLADSIRAWLMTGEWKRTQKSFVTVPEDSAEYDLAPFEAAVLYHRDVPWPDKEVLIKRSIFKI